MDLHLKWLILLSVLLTGSLADDAPTTKHMDTFIKVLETLEAANPDLEPLDVLKALRKVAGVNTQFIEHYLGTLEACECTVNPELTEFLTKMVKHEVTEAGEELGVVFTANGITLALTPLLLGLEAGLQITPSGHTPGLYALTLAQNLLLSFLQHTWSGDSSSSHLGTKGDWNDVADPQVFTVSGQTSLATDALINGGMDGVILGRHVARATNRPQKLSYLLKSYYQHQLDSAGLDAAPSLISQRRRLNFKTLFKLPQMKRQLLKTLSIYKKMDKNWSRKVRQKLQQTNVEKVLEEGLEEFIHIYFTCPPIVSRSSWGAAPYRGTPTQLRLPLSYLYIHHTYQPSQPCLSFQQCSSDMRSMQRYHQDTKGWDDIGYNFVVGSDGNVYEGRGWTWQGAHTAGYNSQGYGVSFIGDFTSRLPSVSTMDLVRNQWVQCALGAKRLTSHFIMHGHRQMVSTSCPGDALYREIKTWKHFRER